MSASEEGSSKALPVLPPEILEPILELACHLDPSIPHTLAYVSKRICSISAPHRFRTVILTKESSLLQFWSLLEAEACRQAIVDEWRLPTPWADTLGARTEEFIELMRTLPTDKAKAEIENRLRADCKIDPPDRWSGIDRKALDGATWDGTFTEELYPAHTDRKRAPSSPTISYPTGKPLGRFVENILIDLEPPGPSPESQHGPPSTWPTAGDARRSALLTSHDLDDGDEGQSFAKSLSNDQTPRGDIFALDDEVDEVRGLVSSYLDAILSKEYGAPWDLVQRVRQLHCRHGHRLVHILEYLPNLERLSLGGAEFQAFNGSFGTMPGAPHELTVVYNGDEESLDALVKSSSSYTQVQLVDGAKRTETDDSKSSPYPTYVLWGIRKRLTKLHVVGIDPHSPLTGVGMPLKQLDALRAGSLSSNSYIDVCMQACSEESATQVDGAEGQLHDYPKIRADEYSTGLRLLRYDTRKFGFRPIEILASRLRLFLQELELKALPSVEETPLSSKDARRSPQLQKDADGLLAHWGVGAFQKLQLSWLSFQQMELMRTKAPAKAKPMTPAEAAARAALGGSPAQSNGQKSQANQNGGWPKEMKDVWTERSGREANNHFAWELVEGIRQLFGWAVPPQIDTSFLQSIRAGIDTSTEQRLSMLGRAVSRVLGIDTNPEPSPAGAPQFSFGIRLPASFMRFEGEAAFEKRQRVALFLDSSAGGPGAWA